MHPHVRVSTHSSQLPIWPHQKLEQYSFALRQTHSVEPVKCACKEFLLKRKQSLMPYQSGISVHDEILEAKLVTGQYQQIASKIKSPRWSPSRPNSASKAAISDQNQIHLQHIERNVELFDMKFSQPSSKRTFASLARHFRAPCFHNEPKLSQDPNDANATKLVEPNLPLWWNREGIKYKEYMSTFRSHPFNADAKHFTENDSMAAHDGSSGRLSSLDYESGDDEQGAQFQRQHRSGQEVIWRSGQGEPSLQAATKTRSTSPRALPALAARMYSRPAIVVRPGLRMSLAESALRADAGLARQSSRRAPRPPPFALDIPSW